jgi:hypothetical protein
MRINGSDEWLGPEDQCECDATHNQIGRYGGFSPKLCLFCEERDEELRWEAEYERRREDGW